MVRGLFRAVLVALAATLIVGAVPCVAFGASAGVSGTVTVSGVGTAIPGACVVLEDAEGSGVRTTTTDASGRYSFEDTWLTTGDQYTVRTAVHGYEAAESTFKWSGSSMLQNLQLVALTPIASGTITDSETGDPIAGALVCAWLWVSPTEVHSIGGMYTASDGTYTIYNESDSEIANGDYVALDIDADGYESLDLSRTSGDIYAGTVLALDVALDPLPVVASGTIADAETGLPIADAYVSAFAWKDGSFYLFDIVQTRADGEFTITDAEGLLQTGDYVAFDVSASHDGYAPFIHSATNGLTYTGSPLTFNVELDLLTVTLEDSAPGVTFDRFVPSVSSAYSGGSCIYGRWTGTRIESRFTGTKIAWYGPKQPSYGKADVYIDDVKVATVDCYAPAESATLSAKLFETGSLEFGTHTISIRLMGAKNAASTGNVVVVDNFQVTNATDASSDARVNETAAVFSGGWVNCMNATYTGTTYRYSRWAGARMSYTFSGTQVAWIGPRTFNYGRADVYIDGVKKATVSQYGVMGWRYRVWESSVLSAGPHTIEIRVLGTKEAASSNTIVVVDGFDVKP